MRGLSGKDGPLFVIVQSQTKCAAFLGGGSEQQSVYIIWKMGLSDVLFLYIMWVWNR